VHMLGRSGGARPDEEAETDASELRPAA
jgi:hypothetical protein